MSVFCAPKRISQLANAKAQIVSTSTSRRELFYGVVAADLAMPLLVAPCVWRQLEPFAVKRDPEDKDASIQEPPGADPTPLLDDADERGASY